MPTPVQAFVEVAARHGDVDPLDPDADRCFYRETLLTLPPDRILAVLEDLLSREGPSEGELQEPFYPQGAALPTCRASPPVPLPLMALGWWSILRRLLGRRSP